MGRFGARRRERRSPPAGSCSSSATGWRLPAPPGPTPGSGSTRRRGGGQLRLVRAAGGVVVRAGSEGPRCSSSTARPTTTGRSRRAKLERGETEEECALREVEEETGLRCTLGRELESTTYRDAKGRRKRVRYWLMEVEVGRARLRQRDRRRAVAASDEAAGAAQLRPRDYSTCWTTATGEALASTRS